MCFAGVLWAARLMVMGILKTDHAAREPLPESQDRWLLVVRLACPDITRACDLARTFADLVRHRRGYLRLEWIRQAEQGAPKPMQGFAGFLRQDLDASLPASPFSGVPASWRDT
ncbi:hypothetical protein ACFWWC_40710 [Streptomyces sp. NPDC058642]|uniref:hypothetical protein n=1 Tax=Streptomyces sp. NPDC058642 TaxID=3346572 RepID=UPI00366A43E4